MFRISNVFSIVLLFVIAVGCSNEQTADKSKEREKETTKIIPEFKQDSAYKFVKEQLDFGPRVPNSEEHKACVKYLENNLMRFADDVIVQKFAARAYNGTILNGYNIIGVFNPDKKARLVLCAHWDSRHIADHDPDPQKQDQPIDGANDGASGVGVLLEIARILKTNKPDVGIDIIFFDLEDYGPPTQSQSHAEEDYWGLGSQYWSRNPHKYGYKARYAILLDMVGVKDPQFRKEGFSMYYARDKVEKVWDIAEEIGYGKHFLDEEGGYITDDHFYINKLKGLSAINIIHLDPGSSNGSFFDHWHTTQDNLENIDPKALGIVGDVLLNVIYRE